MSTGGNLKVNLFFHNGLINNISHSVAKKKTVVGSSLRNCFPYLMIEACVMDTITP